MTYKIRVTAVVLVLLCARSVFATETIESSWSASRATRPADRAWTLNVYGGPGISGPLQNLIRVQKPNLNSYYVGVVSASRRLYRYEDLFQVEGEGQFGVNFEKNGIYQLNPLLAFRWLRLPTEKLVPGGTFGFGFGLSYATDYPYLEDSTMEVKSHTLIYIMLEFAVGLAHDSPVDFMMRVHHRSGGFGMVNGADGGSDYLCMGAKYHVF